MLVDLMFIERSIVAEARTDHHAAKILGHVLGRLVCRAANVGEYETEREPRADGGIGE